MCGPVLSERMVSPVPGLETCPCGRDPRSQACHPALPMWMGPQVTGVPPAHVDGTPGHRCASSWAMTGADSVLQAGEEPLLIPCYFDVS